MPCQVNTVDNKYIKLQNKNFVLTPVVKNIFKFKSFLMIISYLPHFQGCSHNCSMFIFCNKLISSITLPHKLRQKYKNTNHGSFEHLNVYDFHMFYIYTKICENEKMSYKLTSEELSGTHYSWHMFSLECFGIPYNLFNVLTKFWRIPYCMSFLKKTLSYSHL